MKKNLTLRYTVQQCAYWAAAAGTVVFFLTVDKKDQEWKEP